MLRATLACSLMSLCVAAPTAASAEDVERPASAPEQQVGEPEELSACGCSLFSASPEASGCGELRTTSAPLAPEGTPTDWCDRPDDPRCSPASPVPATPVTVAGLQLAVFPAGPPRVAAAGFVVAPPSIDRLLGPSAGVRTAIERPPAA